MSFITVFTPTYNRADKLVRCYLSLLQQKEIEFEWVIIDDGSTDNTKEVVDNFINNNEFIVRYFYQENSGKQAAWNKAIDIAKGMYFIGLDSDDALVPGALKKLAMKSNLMDSSDIIGLRALSVSSKNFKPNSSYLLNEERVSNWFSEFKSGKHGERIDLFKTSIIRNYKYPVDYSVKFIPEIWLYSLVSSKYDFYYTCEKVRVFYDDEKINRLSKSSLRKHAKGHLLSRASLIEYAPLIVWLYRPVDLIKSIIRLNQAYIFASNTNGVSLSRLAKLFVLPGKLIKKLRLFR